MKYYFNLAGAVYDPDVEGVELPDIEAARITAVRHAADYIRDRPDVVWLGEEFRLEVTNSDQLSLFTLVIFGVNAPVLRSRAV